MTHRLLYYDGSTPQAHVANLVVDTDTGFIGVGNKAPTNPLTINSTSGSQVVKIDGRDNPLIIN